MRIDFRQGWQLAVGLLAAALFLVSDLSAPPAHAFTTGPSYSRSVKKADVSRQLSQRRISRSAIRSRVIPAPAPAAPQALEAGMGDKLAKLRHCESGGRYDANTGNGYYGAYQFSAGTWSRLGMSGMPHQASPEAQDEAARKLQARSGWGQWPACSRRIGTR